jgi:hypothetical protein
MSRSVGRDATLARLDENHLSSAREENDMSEEKFGAMNSLSRRRFFGSVAAAAATAASGPAVLIKRAHAAPTLVPRKMPFPPNDNFGNYEPAISADGNTIHFARFANNGDARVKGPTDIFGANALVHIRSCGMR